MHRLGSFLRSFGVSREPLLEPSGTHPGLSWVTLPLLGCLGWPLGALWDQFGLQLGDFVPSWKPTLSPLGSDLASFGYLVCESSLFVPSLEATG